MWDYKSTTFLRHTQAATTQKKHSDSGNAFFRRYELVGDYFLKPNSLTIAR